MSAAWFWPDWRATNPDCSNPPAESCSDAGCPVHGEPPDYDQAERIAESHWTDPDEYDPDDAEAQRIAEVYADAAAEMHWTDTGETS